MTSEKIPIPVAYACKSSVSKEKLLECAEKANARSGNEFVQLFKNSKVVRERLLAAYFNMLLRKEENIMRSNSMAIELLLLVSGQMNISKALKDFGVDGNELILFATSEKLAKLFMECSGIENGKKLRLDFVSKESSRVAVAELLYG